ncbi:uncharacterized protein LOC122896606 [Neovison vison]|uniref:uncharacterized protein LOC122896606 n=1 Tax=Neovison vison TaxID=452646 RepID=UPI001CF08D94|nr:uncharacterized protein LOC122896606 [Neogale vison]
MAVQIFCYIVKDGGWSTCRSVKHGGLLSLPYAFSDRFCHRGNMADLVIWLSWQFITWTSWRGFLPGTFLAGFAPGGPALLLKMAGVVVLPRKVGERHFTFFSFWLSSCFFYYYLTFLFSVYFFCLCWAIFSFFPAHSSLFFVIFHFSIHLCSLVSFLISPFCLPLSVSAPLYVCVPSSLTLCHPLSLHILCICVVMCVCL